MKLCSNRLNTCASFLQCIFYCLHQRKAKEKQADEILPFISTFNSINPPIYNAIKNSVEVLKRNNVPGFESLKIINSKQHPSNLKKLLPKVEFSNEEVGTKKCQDTQCECCNHCYYPRNIHLKMEIKHLH